MERETIKIETPKGKNKIVLKSWLTLAEKRQIDGALLKGVKMDTADLQNPKFDASLISLSQDEAIRQVVVSVDGEVKNVLEKILQMRSSDGDFVIEEINKVTNPPEEVKKK